jgi:PAS domain S-box-containing protein
LALERDDTVSRVRHTIAYVCAVVLPIAAILITVRATALHRIPFALTFLVICALGALSGLGAAVVAILVSLVYFNLPFNAPLHGYFGGGQVQRDLILIGGAFFIILLIWKQRSYERRLRSTLVSLQERTSALSQAQQASELATWLFDPRTMETTWDEGSTQIFGRPFSEIDRKALPLDFIHPDDHQHIRDTVAAALQSDQPVRAEYRVVWPNGEIHWLEARGTRVPGSPNLLRGATFDITRRKAVEAALIQSEKLAAVGRLASTIAHEVNNPLESVTNLLYLIDQDESLNGTTRSYLALAQQELARLANITRLTLTFARNATLPIQVDLAETCDAVLSLYQHRCEVLEIQVDRHYSPGSDIDIPPHELRQILINLFANAVDAAQRGAKGIIRIRTSISGDNAILLVEDNGQGIDPSHQAHVFEAFFTTKADMGTGIGLWVTRELVEKNKGTIAVESGDLEDGMRTRFRLLFPLAASRPSSHTASLVSPRL